MRSSRRLEACFGAHLAGLLAAACSLVTAGRIGAAPPESGGGAESFVAEKVRAGEVADLSQLADRALRVLPAEAVRRLITDAGNRRAVRIRHAVIRGPLELTNEDVAVEVWLDSCEFLHEVNLDQASFKKDLSFEGSVFRRGLSLYRTLLTEDLYLRDASALGGVELTELQARNVQAQRISLTGRLTMDRSTVRGAVRLEGAKLRDVGLEAARIGELSLRPDRDGRRATAEGTLELPRAVIDFADFDHLSCSGKVILDAAEIKTLVLAHTELPELSAVTSTLDRVIAPGLIVRGPLEMREARVARYVRIFDESRVDGSLSLANAFVGNVIELSGSRLGSLDLSGAAVGGMASLTRLRVQGPVDFTGSTFGASLRLEEGRFEEVVRLENVTVRGSLSLRGSAFARLVTFLDISVGYVADLQGAKFQARAGTAADLKGLRADRLSLDGTVFSGTVDVGGLSYQRLEGDTLKSLNTLIEKAPYSGEMYSHLEEYHRKRGSSWEANEAFIRARQRERQRLGWLGRRFDSALGLLIGYGRKPWRAFYLLLPFIAIGTIAFRRERMEAMDPTKASWDYVSLWYSVALLLPFVDLYSSSVWRPKDGPLRHYMRIHILAGWILVPLGLASLTGLIR